MRASLDWRSVVGGSIGVVSVWFALPQRAASQAIERVSVGPGSVEADGHSYMPRLSREGRYVVFLSNAANLVADDLGGHDTDVFVRDLQAGVNELVSTAPPGTGASVWAVRPSLSSDGNFVAFAGNGFDPGDTDSTPDVFVRDRVSGATTWVTPWNDGVPVTYFDLDGASPVVGFHTDSGSVHVLDMGGGGSWSWYGSSDPMQGYYAPVVGRDGRFVLFSHYFVIQPGNSYVFELLRLDTSDGTFQVVSSGNEDRAPVDISNDGEQALFSVWYVLAESGAAHLFLLDTGNGEARRLDVAPDGASGNEGFHDAALSGEGRYVVYTSRASNLIGDDEDWAMDVFVRETRRGSNARASTGLTGEPAYGDAYEVDVSFSGGALVFGSDANNLVPGDTNASSDVFLCNGPFPHFADLDGDGFGAGLPTLSTLPPPAGQVLAAGDCDDADGSVHPLAGELPCTGADENCDGSIDETGLGQSSCPPFPLFNLSSLGCAAHLQVSGCASASAVSGLIVQASNLEGQRNSMLFYGLTGTLTPFGNDWLCVGLPRQRMDVHGSGGTAGVCDGAFTEDLLAWIAAHPTSLGAPAFAGEPLFLQAWFRDPPAPRHASLTSGWELTLLP